MGHKKKFVVYTKQVPLRDRGILAKAMSPKETELNENIAATVEHLEKNTSVRRSEVNLYDGYKAWVNSRMPGTSEEEKSLLATAVKSFRLIIEQQRGLPLGAFLQQHFFPSPFPVDKVTALNSKFKATLVPLNPEDRVLVVDDQEVHHRLVVSMDYDLTRPAREQILEFSAEAEILVAQYCVYRNSKEEDDEQEAKD